MTETAPSCMFVVGTHARAGLHRPALPGCRGQAGAHGRQAGVRFRGPNVMPGYWREPELTAGL